MKYDEIRNHFYGTLGFIQLLNMKITHGGCTFALADTIGGCAALTHGGSVVTVDSSIHYLTPACNTEKLIAEAKEIKYGSKIAVYEVNIYKNDGTIVATSTQSYFIVSNNKPKSNCDSNNSEDA